MEIEREEAKENIEEKQWEMSKRREPRRKIIYQKGDRVLLHNTKLMSQWSGKLEPKWTGPFTVQKKLTKGSYLIKNKFGKTLSTPIHSDRLKIYKERMSEPMIVIEQEHD